MPTIVAVSGQPTKNLGATIVNAGNTPAGAAGTNDATNNPSFGTLLGSNTGKSSGSKMVESLGTASSGVGGSIPGVQKSSTKQEQEFASTTVGATISKTLTTGENQIGKATVGWKNYFRQYPTKCSPGTYYKPQGPRYEYACGAWRDPDGVSYVWREGGGLFGSSVQIAQRSAGDITIAAGAPSGDAAYRINNLSADPADREGPYTNNNTTNGFVDSWEHNLETMPGIPGEVGTLSAEGFSAVDNDEHCGQGPSSPPQHCPGHLNGYQRIDTRILWNGDTNELRNSSFGHDNRHTVSASGAGAGHSIAFNDDGSRMAVGMPYADSEKGEVRVYERCNIASSGNYWHRVGGQISGNQKGDRLGWSVALDGDGNTLFAGAPRPKGSGYVQLHELSGYGGSASWTQTAAACSSGVSPRDKYGYSVSCNSLGTSYAVGAPDGSGTRGYAQIFAYIGSWMTTRRGVYTTFKQSQQTPSPNGKTKVQRIVGEASGERLGWSVDMMYNCLPSTKAGKYNLRVAVGSPYWSRSVAEYDWTPRTFAQKAAGVPIWDGVTTFTGAGLGFNPIANGLEFQTKGLTSEGKVSCWGYSGETMLQTKKYGFSSLEFLQFGKSSSKEIMRGSQLSELGYSVKISDEGDFLVAGAPGSDLSSVSDCDVKTDSAGGKGEEDDPTIPPPVNPGDPCQPGILEMPSGGENYDLGTGEVRVYRYLWKGSDGDDGRRQHYRDEEDYFIKYGGTLKGIPVPDNYRRAAKEGKVSVSMGRYRRPNFQSFGQGENYTPKSYAGERFGTSVGVFAQFQIGATQIPQLVVGSPYAFEEDYGWGLMEDDNGGIRFFSCNVTGRIDGYSAMPTFSRDNVMPMGAGRTRIGGGLAISTRTKPTLVYNADGSSVLGSGALDKGGRESYFIAPNVSGSGLSNDNALKTSRKTFGTGGINFTSSD